MAIVKLTQQFIDSQLVCPAGESKIEFCDNTIRGLLIRVTASGKAVPVYLLRYKRNRKTAYDNLGNIKELTLAQARKLAIQQKVLHAQEEKLAPKETKPSGQMTLEVFLTEHYLPYAKIHKRSWIRDSQLINIRIIPRLGSTKLCDLTRYQVLQFQNELSTTKLSPASQDHVIKVLRHALNLGVEWQFIEKNVLTGIKLLNVDNQLHDVPTPEQLKKLVEVLRTDKNRPVCNILMFLLSTGARLGECLKAKRDEFDFERGLWTIPASTAKSKKTSTIPLNESALMVLREAAKMHEFETIFANPATGKAFTTITRVWYRLRKLAGISKMRIHATRHLFGDALVASGRSLYDVQVLLRHSDPRVSQRYARLSMHTLKEAANTVSLFATKSEADATDHQGQVVPFTKVA
jgi:integrase